jgi:hypothetical protein
LLDPHRLHLVAEVPSEDLVTIPQQIAERYPKEALRALHRTLKDADLLAQRESPVGAQLGSETRRKMKR